jgi:FOG: CheY-like receiver
MSEMLEGLSVLLLEDEFLIAMDVEQSCRDHGADTVVIARTVEEAEQALAATRFDGAIVDLMLAGTSTLPFAADLASRAVPFIFASGYSDSQELARAFPGVPVVTKPYAGDDLIQALAMACGRHSGADA